MENIGPLFLESAKKRLIAYKELGEKTFAQLTDEQLNWHSDAHSSSIAVIVRHMSGNMLSRWTHFLTEDGEKPWRERDAEFEEPQWSKAELIAAWEKGWQCLLHALNALTTDELSKTVSIRHEPLSVTDAILRQLAHYAYHIGQIVYIGKLLLGNQWKSLSIPPKGVQQ